MLLIIDIYMFIGVLVNGFELVHGYICYRDKFDEWSKEVGEWSLIKQLRAAIVMIFWWPKLVKLMCDEYWHD